MSNPKPFSDVLREWAEVFHHRSIGDFKKFMDDCGLSMSQVHTLMRLYHGGPCGVTEIGEHLGVTNAAASQMVEKLVQWGLVDRSEDIVDRRVKTLRLTTHGRTLIEKSIEARRQWMEELTQALTPEQQQTIAEALTVLTEAARKLEK